MLPKEINFRKLSWKYLNCSLYDLHDIMKELYERGKEDERKRIEAETKTESHGVSIETSSEQIQVD